LLKVFYDPVFLLHDGGPEHPESPSRLEAVMAAARSVSGVNVVESCRKAEIAELALVHQQEYIDRVQRLSGDKLVMLDPDTPLSPHSFEAALRAAGSVMEAVDFVFAAPGNRAFCAVRPPGHHAEPNRAMGFCIFNNIAIGAAYAINKGLTDKIAIIDWDVHHCNGTQKMFYDNPQVMVVSLHQYPFFPGTGGSFESGEADGLGYTINLPMWPGGGDNEFRGAFSEIILPAIKNFEPGLIMISAGFDAHRDDPMAFLNLSTGFFGEMTKMMTEMANRYCGGRIVSVLEGGYNLMTLAECVKIHLEVLDGKDG
jgi:acetoin utilization deacetylase AcuC-like enzyme